MAVTYRIVPGHPGYRVGDDGSVWGSHLGQWRKLCPAPNSGGYLRITLYDGPLPERWLVQRLVLHTFVGPCPVGMEACHWDGDRTNNALGNLRWDTKPANRADRWRHGTHAGGKKLTDDEVRSIKTLWVSEWLGIGDIARVFGVSYQQIRNIVTGKHWPHIPAEVFHV